jgi:formylglycine-generating enzyme required for sulfatase activity
LERYPVTWVNWYDAARFVNWLNNGKGAADTEHGVYTLTGLTSVSGGRSPDAKFFLPTEDEWHKAAFYQPASAGGDTDNYWYYATRSNVRPSNVPPPGGANAANFYANPTGFALTGGQSLIPGFRYLTEVGSYAEASSYYGTFDQAGNVWEWNETVIIEENIYANRGLGGGSWLSGAGLPANGQYDGPPDADNLDVGFRVASVPESSDGLVASFCVPTLLRRRSRQPKAN